MYHDIWSSRFLNSKLRGSELSLITINDPLQYCKANANQKSMPIFHLLSRVKQGLTCYLDVMFYNHRQKTGTPFVAKLLQYIVLRPSIIKTGNDY
jgi:hypothetical protein